MSNELAKAITRHHDELMKLAGKAELEQDAATADALREAMHCLVVAAGKARRWT